MRRRGHSPLLFADAWPTLDETNEALAGQRTEWLRPYRTLHGPIPRQHQVLPRVEPPFQRSVPTPPQDTSYQAFLSDPRTREKIRAEHRVLTLGDWAKRLDPEGSATREICELLKQTNELLLDTRWMTT